MDKTGNGPQKRGIQTHPDGQSIIIICLIIILPYLLKDLEIQEITHFKQYINASLFLQFLIYLEL